MGVVRIQELLRTRLDRGFSIRSIGANEARVLFDGSVAAISVLLTLFFCRLVTSTSIRTRDVILSATLPVLFVVFNALLGVYSRYRVASARIKACALCASIVLTSLAGWVVLRSLPVILLWAMLVTGPVTLARLLLSLHADRHRSFTRIVTNDRGPVLVLGGAGYIGSHTVALLLQRGREVRVLDRLMYGDAVLKDFRENPRFSLIEGDVTDIAKLTAAMKDCSAVVHLAGLVGDPACAVSPEFTRHTNIIATRMAREVAEAMGIHRFIFASSCSVYGISSKEVTETDALNPASLYAETKIDSERELLVNSRDDFFVTILRFATVFGHSRRPRFDLVANLFTAQALNDGLITVIGPHQWRPFIHVRDLARAILATLEADTRIIQSQIFNVGDKRLNMTILDLAERVRAATSAHRSVEISIADNPSDRRNYAVSFEKIQRALGFQAETTIEEGVQEMVDRLLAGEYAHYRSSEYSNVAMTARAVEAFHDADQATHLYAPLNAR
jgi:nucleoside-diphosphate-sugar epimerase